MEVDHSVTIQMNGPYNNTYKSEWFNNLINKELDVEILNERAKLFKKLKPITDVLEEDWTGVMAITVGSDYSETLSYRHHTSIAPEISFVISNGRLPQLSIPMSQLSTCEFIDGISRYLNTNGSKHTESLIKKYRSTCKSVTDHYGLNSKILQSTDTSIHCFTIAPQTRTSESINKLCMQLILAPKYRGNQVSEQMAIPVLKMSVG